MAVGHPSGHARHRRQQKRMRSVLVVTVVAVIGVALVVVALVWGTRDSDGGRATSSGRPAGAPAATAAGSGAPKSAPAAPAASLATPTAGAAVPVGRAPHFVEVAPDGRFAYIADPVAGAVFRFDTARDTVTATIPIPEGPPQMLTFAPDGNRAYVAGYSADYSV
ncbi:MAG: YncE family protein, partial [Blastococcus sp.]